MAKEQKTKKIEQAYKPIKIFFETNPDLKEIANIKYYINSEEHPEIVNNQNYKIYRSLLANAERDIAVINSPMIVEKDNQYNYIYKRYMEKANKAYAEAYP